MHQPEKICFSYTQICNLQNMKLFLKKHSDYSILYNCTPWDLYDLIQNFDVHEWIAHLKHSLETRCIQKWMKSTLEKILPQYHYQDITDHCITVDHNITVWDYIILYNYLSLQQTAWNLNDTRYTWNMLKIYEYCILLRTEKKIIVICFCGFGHFCLFWTFLSQLWFTQILLTTWGILHHWFEHSVWRYIQHITASVLSNYSGIQV